VQETWSPGVAGVQSTPDRLDAMRKEHGRVLIALGLMHFVTPIVPELANSLLLGVGYLIGGWLTLRAR
jgi:hypothetical protein